RHVLLSGITKPLGARTEALLFAAARDDHVRNTIAPALAAGKWVICDRFIDSTRIYQGALGGLDAKIIRGLQRVTVRELNMDLTCALDVPAEVGLARAGKRRGARAADRFEAESRSFHEKLRQAYRLLAAADPERCVLIDATAAKPAVAERIWTLVNERLDPTAAVAAVAGAAS